MENFKNVVLVIFVVFLSSCDGVKQSSKSEKWLYEMHGIHFYEMYKKDQIEKDLLIELLSYPLTKDEFVNKKYGEVISIIRSKSRNKNWVSKKCPLPEICAEISINMRTSEKQLAYELLIVNETRNDYILDTVEIDMQISSFGLPSTFTYTNFEKSELSKGKKIKNNIFIPENYIETKLLIVDAKSLSLEAEDLKIDLKKVVVSLK